MVKLSLNVNKIATLRNSRGGRFPNLIKVVEDLLRFGAEGITVHPRPDGRHILYEDVRQIKKLIKKYNDAKSKFIELNVEGFPSEDFLKLMDECLPDQCTLVPDPPDVLTSDQGWDLKKNFDFLKKILLRLKKNKIRSSCFIDPISFSKEDLHALSSLKPDRVEFYTGAWAQCYDQEAEGVKNGLHKNLSSQEILDIYKQKSKLIGAMGIGINAGHDLNQKNLKPLLEAVHCIQELSIGHAFICESLYDGLEMTFKNYMNILKGD